MTRTRKILLTILAVCLIILLAKSFFYFNTVRSVTAQELTSVPEFTDLKSESWLNSKPLPLASLKGRVVLLFFWTFG